MEGAPPADPALVAGLDDRALVPSVTSRASASWTDGANTLGLPVPFEPPFEMNGRPLIPAGLDEVLPPRQSRASGRTLVLNVTMEPLCVVPSRRAIVLLLGEKADVVHSNGHRFRSERLDIASPLVVRLRSYVRVPYRRRAALSRRGVFIRDDFTCQYCGVPAENVDHVQPRSRGGPHCWENVVAACRRCNSRKKDRTPAEARMALPRQPYAPQAAFWLVVAVGGLEPVWDAYLGSARR